MLDSLRAATAAKVARVQLGKEILDDLRRLDGQLSELHDRLAGVVGESSTSLTRIFSVGPATVLGITGEVTRFPAADRFAAYAGTAPIDASSGPHRVFRLPDAVTANSTTPSTRPRSLQTRNRHSDGYAYYHRKIGAGMTTKMALRALKADSPTPSTTR